MALTQVHDNGLTNTGVTAATYGSSSAIPSLTIDAKGRVTSATTSAIDSTSISNGTSNVSVANGSDITFTRGGNERFRVDSNGARLFDNSKIQLGDANDLQIYHDGSESYIADEGTGGITISSGILSFKNQARNETHATMTVNGSVDLYYDNNKKFATKSDGIDVTGEVQCDYLDVDGAADITGNVVLHNHLDLDDNNHIRIGNGDDLKIYHDGTNSRIHDQGTGGLILQGDAQINLQSASNENYIECVSNGAVTVYHNNNAKLATKSDGVNVQGELECDSLDVDGAGDFTGGCVFRGGAGGVDVRAGSDIRLENGGWTGDSAGKIQHHGDWLYVQGGSNGIIFRHSSGSNRVRLDSSGHLRPDSNNSYDLGRSDYRWRNVYTNDLNLSNEGSANDVDGTWGNFTIQEGENDLFLINRRSGKKYKFNLTEVN